MCILYVTLQILTQRGPPCSGFPTQVHTPSSAELNPERRGRSRKVQLNQQSTINYMVKFNYLQLDNCLQLLQCK